MLIETEKDRVSLFCPTTSLILLLLVTTSSREDATASCIAMLTDATVSLTSMRVYADWVMSPEFVAQARHFSQTPGAIKVAERRHKTNGKLRRHLSNIAENEG